MPRTTYFPRFTRTVFSASFLLKYLDRTPRVTCTIFQASSLRVKYLARSTRVAHVSRSVLGQISSQKIWLALLASIASLALFPGKFSFIKIGSHFSRHSGHSHCFSVKFPLKRFGSHYSRHSHCFSVKFTFKIFCPHPSRNSHL